MVWIYGLVLDLGFGVFGRDFQVGKIRDYAIVIATVDFADVRRHSSRRIA